MKHKIKITIEANFGSDFQEKIGMNILNLSIDFWKKYMETKHKKTIITIKKKQS